MNIFSWVKKHVKGMWAQFAHEYYFSWWLKWFAIALVIGMLFHVNFKLDNLIEQISANEHSFYERNNAEVDSHE